jgi:histidine phosphotransferase ChpT
VLRETLSNGASGAVEPRAAAAWLAHNLISEAQGTIQLSDPSSDALTIGARLPTQG